MRGRQLKKAHQAQAHSASGAEPPFTARLRPLARCIKAAMPVSLLLGAGPVLAGPEGGQVVAGQGQISRPDTNTTVINQQSHRLSLDWSSFNIAQNELVQFNQPSAQASALNRIYDQNPSQIHGALRANGEVVLMNPNGVFFGRTARVNVGALIASGLDIKPRDFMAGEYKFQPPTDEKGDTSEGGAVINQGLLQAATGGAVTLIGGAVKNDGVILATAGQVNLLAGRQLTMDFDGDGLIQFAVEKEILENAHDLDDAISNSGQIKADGGAVLLHGKAARDVFSQVINNEGLIKAGRIDNRGGRIKLVAAGAGATLLNTGTLDAAAVGGGKPSGAGKGGGQGAPAGGNAVGGGNGRGEGNANGKNQNIARSENNRSRAAANGGQAKGRVGSDKNQSQARNLAKNQTQTEGRAGAGKGGLAEAQSASRNSDQVAQAGGEGTGQSSRAKTQEGSLQLAQSKTQTGSSAGQGAAQSEANGRAEAQGSSQSNSRAKIKTKGAAPAPAASKGTSKTHSEDANATPPPNPTTHPGGTIELFSAGNTLIAGRARIDASSASGKGGTVQILGLNHVGLLDAAAVDVFGATGGGTALLGGDYRGQNPAIPNARRTYLSPQAKINAAATERGAGGRIIVWADDNTQYYGRASVRGGPAGGDGGFVEVSGQRLDFAGTVDLAAPKGQGGSLLLDPRAITITDGGTDNSPQADLAFAAAPDETTISEATLEATAAADNATITLEARYSIILDNLTDNELTLADGVSLVLRTRNEPADNSTGRPGIIQFRDPNDAIRAQGAGSLTLEAGVGTAAAATIFIGALQTETGAITLDSVGTITSGELRTTGGAISATSTAGSISADALNSGGGAVGLIADRDISTDALNSGGGAVSMRADRNLILRPVNTAGGALTLRAGNRIDLRGNLNSGTGALEISGLVDATGAAATGTLRLPADRTLRGGDITLNANVIRQGAAHSLTINGAAISLNGALGTAAAALGAVDLEATGNILIAQPINASGAINLRAGRNIGLNAPLRQGANLNPVSLQADGDITFSAAGRITSSNGAVSLTADNDGDSSGALSMADGALINAGSATITLQAAEDLTIGRLLTANATDTAVRLTSTTAGIVDGGDSGGADVQAAQGRLQIRAATGVGAAGPIETEVASLDLENRAGGDVFLLESDALDVANLDSPGGGSVLLSATGVLSILRRQAADGSPTDTIRAGGDVFLTGTAGITTAGNITTTGQIDLGGSSIEAGANITTAGANIAFSAPTTLTADDLRFSSGVGPGTIRFSSTLDSDAAATPRNLTIAPGAGAISFGGAVGGAGPLGRLTLAPNASALTIGDQSVGSGATPTINDASLNQVRAAELIIGSPAAGRAILDMGTAFTGPALSVISGDTINDNDVGKGSAFTDPDGTLTLTSGAAIGIPANYFYTEVARLRITETGGAGVWVRDKDNNTDVIYDIGTAARVGSFQNERLTTRSDLIIEGIRANGRIDLFGTGRRNSGPLAGIQIKGPIDAGGGTVRVWVSGEIGFDPGGRITTASSSANAVRLESRTIVDRGPDIDVDAPNGRLEIEAFGDVGAGNALDTRVARLDVDFSALDRGSLAIDEADALDIDQLIFEFFRTPNVLPPAARRATIRAGGEVNFTGVVKVGSLSVDSAANNAVGGTISDTGAGQLSITHSSTFAAGAGNILLNNPANDFGGAVSIPSGAAATLQNDNALSLGAINISGALDVAAVGIDVTGALRTAAVGLDAGSGTLTLARIRRGGIQTIPTLRAAGPVNLRGNRIEIAGNLTTTGQNIAFNAPTTLTDKISLSTRVGRGGSITFGATLDSDAPANPSDPATPRDLTLIAGTGDIAFRGAVGAAAPLGAVTINNAANVDLDAAFSAASLTQRNSRGTTTIGAALDTRGAINLRNANIEVAAAGGIDAGAAVTLNAANEVRILGAGTKIAADGAVSLSGGTGIGLAGDITTSDDNITFNAATTLRGAVKLDAGRATVRFDGAVDSDSAASRRSLEIRGDADLNAPIGAREALAALLVDGRADLGGGEIRTSSTGGGTGAQTYARAVSLSAATTLNSDGGDIAFNVAINGAQDLSLDAGTGAITFTGPVGQKTRLGAVSIANVGALTVNAFTAASLTQGAGTGATKLNETVITHGAAGVSLSTDGAIAVNDVINTTGGSQGDPVGPATGRLTLDAGGTLTLLDAVVFAGGAVSLSGAGGIFTSGGIGANNANIRFNSPTTLRGELEVTTNDGGGNIEFVDTLDGAFGLNLNAGSGNIEFAGAVGATEIVGNVSIDMAADLAVRQALTARSFRQAGGSGTTTVSGALETRTGNVSIVTDAIAFTGPIDTTTSLGSVTLTTTGGALTTAAIRAGAVVALRAAAELNVRGPITSSNGTVSLDAAGLLDIAAGGNIRAPGEVKLNSPVGIRTAGDITTTAADITLNELPNAAITLTGPVALTTGAGAGNIRLSGPIDGTHDLSLDAGAGAIRLDGAVGASTALGAVSLTGAGGIRVQAISTENAAISFNSAFDLQSDLALDTDTGAGNITFAAALDSDAPATPRALSLSAGTGNITFAAAVGATAPLGAVRIDSAADVGIGDDAADTFTAASLTQSAGSGTTIIPAAELSAALDITTDEVEMNSIRARAITINTTGNVTARVLPPNGQVLQSGDPAPVPNQDVRATTGDLNIVAGGAIILEDAGAPNRRTRLVTERGDIALTFGRLEVQSNDTDDAPQIVSAGALVLRPDSAAIRILTVGDDALPGGAPDISDASLNSEAPGGLTIDSPAPIPILLDMAVPFTGRALTLISGGTINDAGTATSGVAFSDVGGTLTLRAGAGIGSQANPLDVDVTRLTVTETGGAEVFVFDAGTSTTTYDIGAAAAVGAVRIDKTDGNLVIGRINAEGEIDLQVALSAVINGAITSANPNPVKIEANGNVIFEPAGRIISANGAVTVAADANRFGNGSLLMKDGSSIDAGNAPISLRADNDITLGSLRTSNAGNDAVRLESVSGGIVDGGDAGGADVQAANGRLVISAQNGVGVGGALDIEVASLALTNSARAVAINEADALVVAELVNPNRRADLSAGGAVQLGRVSVGRLDVDATVNNAAGGAISDSDRLTIVGPSTFTAGAGNDLTLDNAGNDFRGAVRIVSARAVTLIDANAIDLGASTIGGDLAVTAGGAISDSGALAVGGATTLDAGGNAITLDDAANDFTGTVSVSGTSALILTDQNDLNLGALTTTAAADIDAGGTASFGGAADIGPLLDVDANAINLNAALTVGEADLNAAVGALSILVAGDISASTGAVTLTAAGGIDTAGNITTNDANITFNSATTLSGAVALSTGAGDIRFTDTLDGAQDLALSAGTGAIEFDAAVGATTRLGAVTIASAANVELNAAFSAASLTQNDGTGATTIAALLDTSGAVDMRSLDITIPAAGEIAAGGAVSLRAANQLSIAGVRQTNINAAGAVSLTGTAAGIRIAGDIMTTDENITFNSPTVLSGAVNVDAGSATVRFAGAVDGNSAATRRSLGITGNADIDAPIGAGQALRSLLISGTANLGGGQINTSSTGGGTGDQTYRGAVTLSADTTLNSDGGDIAFGAAIDGAQDLELSAGSGAIAFDAAVGGANRLGAVQIISAGTVNLGNEAADTFAAASLTQRAGTGATTINATLSTNTASGVNLTTTGAINLNNAIDTTTGNGALSLNATGGNSTISIAAAGDITAGGAVFLSGSGGIDTAADISTSDANITFNSATTLRDAIALNTGVGAGDIRFAGTLDGTQDLSLDAGTGAIAFAAAVGATNPLGDVLIHSADTLDLGAAFSAASLTQRAGTGATTLDGALATSAATGVSLTTAGDISVNAAMSTTGSGPVRLNAGGTLRIAKTTLASGASAATINADGEVNLTGAAGITTAGNITTTNDNITFSSATTLAADNIALLSGAGAGDILFAATLNSDAAATPRSVNFSAGTGAIAFAAAVGGTSPLGAVLINTAGDLNIGNDTADTFAAASLTQNDGTGTTTIEAEIETRDAAGVNLTTDGAINLNNDIDTTSGDGLVSLDARGALTIAVVFIDAGGAVSLTGAGPGGIRMDADIATNNANITFNSATTLRGPIILNTGAGAGDIRFVGTLDGAYTLELDAGTGAIVLEAPVGGTTPLVSLSMITSGQVELNNLTVTGEQTFNAANINLNGMAYTSTGGALIFNTPVELNAGPVRIQSGGGAGDNILFADAINGAQDLTLAAGAGGNIRLDGAVGGTTPLTAFSIENAADVALGAVQAETIAITATGTVRARQGAAAGNQDLLATAGDLAIDADVIVLEDAASPERRTRLVTNTGDIALDFARLEVQSNDPSNAAQIISGGALALRPTGALTIGDEAAPPGTAPSINDGALNAIAGALTLGSPTAGAVTLDMAVPFTGSALTILSGATISDNDQGAFAFSDVDGTLTLNAAGDIGSTANPLNLDVVALTVSGSGANALWVTDAGSTPTSYALGGATDATRVGAVSLTQEANGMALARLNAGGAVDLSASAAAIDFAGVVAAANLTATAGGGAITQSGGQITVVGATMLAAAGNNITLDRPNNDFGDLVSIRAGVDATLVDAGFIELGDINLSGRLDVRAGGALTLAGAVDVDRANFTIAVGGIGQARGRLTVANETIFDVGGNVSLTSADNDFSEVRIVKATDLRLQDADAIIFGRSTIRGDFTVTAGGAITDSGALSVGGATTLEAGGNAITLDDPANDFTGAVALSAADATLVDANAIELGALNLTGLLDVRAHTISLGEDATAGQVRLDASAGAGAILQAGGSLTVAGTTRLVAQPGDDINLGAAGNDFRGAVTVAAAADAARRVAGKLTLADSNALSLGAITIGGDAVLDAGGAVDFSGLANIGGDLSLNSTANNAVGGAIIDSGGGRLLVAGTSTFTAGAGNDLTLDNAGNDFRGAVRIVSARAVTLIDANAIDLGAATVSGDLAVTAGGAITDSGALAVGGATTLAAGGNAVTLDDINNDFSGAVSVSGTSALTLTDQNDLNLGALTTTAAADIDAGGTASFGGAADIGALLDVDANAINLNAALTVGEADLNAAVGALSILVAGDISASTGAVTLTAAGGIDTAGNITTNDANITFNSATTLSGAVALNTGAGAGDIRFTDTLDGAQDLAITAGTGAIAFDGAVGTTTRLGAVTIASAGTVDLNAAFSAASLTQTTGSGTTTIDAALNTNTASGVNLSTSGAIAVNNTITTSGNGIVSLDSGDITIAASGSIAGGANVDLDASGNILVNSTIAADTLVSLDATGTLRIAAAGDINAGDAVELAATGGITTAGDITTTNANITFNSATTLSGAVALNTGAGGGDIRFAGTLDGAQDLELSAGSGAIAFDDDVGGTTRLGAVRINSAADVGIGDDAADTFTAASLTQRAGTGTTTINAALSTNRITGVNLTTTGAININNRIDTTTAAGLVSLNSGDITIAASGSITGGANVGLDASGNITISSTIAADTLVSMDATGTLRIAAAGDINAGDEVELTAAGGIATAGDITTNDANITFNSATTLSDAVALNSGAGAGDIRFTDTLDGAQDLALTAGTGAIEFDAAVGATTRLGAVAINSAGNVELNAAFSAASLTQNDGTGETTIAAALSTNTATGVNLSTTGAIAVNNTITTTGNGIVSLDSGDITLAASGSIAGGANVDLDASGNILVNSTIAADTLVNLDATGTLSILAAGDINAGAAVSLTAAGGISTAGDISTRDANISFNSATTLTGAVRLNTGAGAGDISFDGTLNGAQALSLTAGTGAIAFDATVGATTALASLNLSTSGPVDVNNLRTTGAQSLAGSTINLNGAAYTSTSGALSFTGVINLAAAANPTIASDAGDITLAGPVNLGAASLVRIDTDADDAGAAGSLSIAGAINDDAPGSTSLTLDAGATGDIELQSIANGGLSNTGGSFRDKTTSTTYLDAFTIEDARNVRLSTMIANTISIRAQGDITAVVQPPNGVALPTPTLAVNIPNQDIRARTGDLTVSAGGTLTLQDATGPDRRTRLVTEQGAIAPSAAATTVENFDLTNAPQIVSFQPVTLNVPAGVGAVTIGDDAAAPGTMPSFGDSVLNLPRLAIDANGRPVILDMASAFGGELLEIRNSTTINDAGARASGLAFFRPAASTAPLTLTLSSDGDIGSAANPLSVDVDRLNITESGGNALWVTDAGSTPTTYDIGGAAAVGAVSLTQRAGNMRMARLNANAAANLSASAGAIDFAGPVAADSLNATAGGGAITQTAGALTITGAATLEASNSISLGDFTAGAALGVTANAGAIDFVGTVNADSLNATAGGGAITQTAGTLTISGAATLEASDSISLGELTAGAALDLTASAGAIDFAGPVAADSLTATAGGGAITQTAGTLTITGAATLEASNSISLGELTAGAALSLTANAGAIDFASPVAADSLTASAGGGAITQTAGTLTITGAATLSAAGNDINLAQANNDFGGVLTITRAAALTLADTDDLTLGAVTTTGDADISAAATLDFTGAANIDGALTVAAQAIELNANVGAATVDFDARAGGITQSSGRLSATGAATLDATGDINLGELTTGNALGLTASAGAINFAGAVSADSLTATAGGGDITQTAAAITINGTARLAARAGDDIRLAQVGNDFIGVVSITGAGNNAVANNVTLADANDLTLDTARVANDLTLNFGLNSAATLDLSAAQLSAGGTVFVNGGAAGATDDTLRISNTRNTWTITGSDAGTIDAGGTAYAFTNLAGLIGNAAADTFILAAGGSVSGRIDGGAGSDILDFFAPRQSIVISGLGTLDGFAGAASSLAQFDNINEIDGAPGSDTLIDSINADALFTLAAADNIYSSSGRSLTFRNIDNLEAGSGDDRFVFNAGAVLAGTARGGEGDDVFTFNGGSVRGAVEGQAGEDALDLAALAGEQRVDTDAGSISIDDAGGADVRLTGFSGIERFVGDDSADTFLGSGTFTSTAPNAGTLDGLRFVGFANLRGKGNADTLVNNSAYVLTAVDAGTASNLSGGFSGMENLHGSTGDDRFTFNAGGSLSGSVDGLGGTDTLVFSEVARVRLEGLGSVDGFAGSTTGAPIGDGFDNVDTLVGSAAVDSLTGADAAAVWAVTGGGDGSYRASNSLNFTSFEDLRGGNQADVFAIRGAHVGALAGGGGADTFNFSAGGVLTGTARGGAGDDVFVFIGGSMSGDIDGESGSDSLDFSATGAVSVVLSAVGATDGFAGSASNINNGGFENIDAVVGSPAVDSLAGLDVPAAWTVAMGNGSYTSTNTLNFASLENFTGGAAADEFDLDGAHAGDIDGADGDDIFNFNSGSHSGSITGAAGNNTYNHNGGSNTALVVVEGNDVWNYAAGVALGTTISGTGNLTVPNVAADGRDTGQITEMAVDTSGLNLPDLGGFSGHLIIGGIIDTPELPLGDDKTITVNTALLTLNIPVATGGAVTLLGQSVDLNADISAGGTGGEQLAIFATGDGSAGATSSGNITGVALPVNIAAGNVVLAAANGIQQSQNIELQLGGGELVVSTGQQDTLQFGVLEAEAADLTPELVGFLTQFSVAGVDGEIAFSTEANLNITQVNQAGSLLGLEQLSSIDTGLFEQDLSLFSVVGQGVALSLAQCEEIEGCAPNVTDAELDELISALQGRIDELDRRLLEEGSARARAQLEELREGYRKELQNFEGYKQQLEAFYAAEEAELGDDEFAEQFGDEFDETDTVAAQIKVLRETLAVTQQRIDWLEGLKGDAEARTRLGAATGIELTIEALDGIIEATRQEVLFIESQIELLLQGTQAGRAPIFRAESSDPSLPQNVHYGPSLLNLDAPLVALGERWY